MTKTSYRDAKTMLQYTDEHPINKGYLYGAQGDLSYDEVSVNRTFYPNISDSLIGYHEYKRDFRGDTARILFYMVIRYEGLSLTNNINEVGDTTLGILSTLLTWNNLDPVDEFETQRNNRIYEYQGNRNPFIYYPDIANIIFT